MLDLRYAHISLNFLFSKLWFQVFHFGILLSARTTLASRKMKMNLIFSSNNNLQKIKLSCKAFQSTTAWGWLCMELFHG